MFCHANYSVQCNVTWKIKNLEILCLRHIGSSDLTDQADELPCRCRSSSSWRCSGRGWPPSAYHRETASPGLPGQRKPWLPSCWNPSLWTSARRLPPKTQWNSGYFFFLPAQKLNEPWTTMNKLTRVAHLHDEALLMGAAGLCWQLVFQAAPLLVQFHHRVLAVFCQDRTLTALLLWTKYS